VWSASGFRNVWETVVVYGGVVKEDVRGWASGLGRGVALAWLAWSVAGVCVFMLVVGLTLSVLDRSAEAPAGWVTVGFVRDMLTYALLLTFALVGALIASRRPGNLVGWICLADGLLWMLLGLSETYAVYRTDMPGLAPLEVGAAWLSNWLWAPALGLFATYLLLLFPNGRLPSRRWRPLAWLSGGVIVSLSISVGLAPGPLQNVGGMRNPLGLEGHPWVADAFPFIFPLLPVCILGSVLSVVLRYRNSGSEEREQIKWIAFAASVVVVLFLVGLVVSLFSSTEFFDSVAVLSYPGVPIAVGFAVLKYRLYDIEVVINRALVYGSLTAMLLALYFGGVASTQAIFRAITGQEQQPQLAIVVSTLIIAALFAPLRRRIQSFIDRRFYRSKYDARKTLEAFSATLRDETDLDALRGELLSAVTDTMQPAHVSLWLSNETRQRARQTE
jgi:hypothetical protein